MRYRDLPVNGLRLPVIGFGTGDNAGLMVTGDAYDQRAAVLRALELGIDYFDTAPDYGRGRAEENLGRALSDVGKPVVISTKVEVCFDDFDDIAGSVERSVEGSLRRLGVDRLDIVQIHNGPDVKRAPHTSRWGALTIGDYLDKGGALEGLERMRSQGKVGLFGFTCAHADSDAVRTLVDTGAFAIINMWFNALNPTAGYELPDGLKVDRDYDRIIDYAAAHSVGVAAFRPLAGGALTAQATDGQGRHPLAGGAISSQPGPYLLDLERARALASSLDCDGPTLARFGYRFALDHPGVTTVLGGFSDLDQLETVADIADEPGLTPAERDALTRAWQSNFDMPEEKV